MASAVPSLPSPPAVSEPFPIFFIRGRYVLFDPATIAHARAQHHILGNLFGNIPQANQQNIFSGAPQLLMSEEALLLVEKGAAFVVDDAELHKNFPSLDAGAKTHWIAGLEKRGLMKAKEAARLREESKRRGLEKQRLKQLAKKSKQAVGSQERADADTTVEDNSLFGPSSVTSASLRDSVSSEVVLPMFITPHASYPPLTATGTTPAHDPPRVASYDLYKHMHDRDYFLSAGIRFGCTYMAYPGDPLRFHSHFLTVAKRWDEPIDLIDIVGGGRLGTGVKKGFLLGGAEEGQDKSQDKGNVRTFCFEWAAM